MANDARVLLRRPNQGWQQPQVDSYTDERAWQQLLLESPALIPGVGSAAAVDELYLGVGSVDVVAVEPSGTITLVECKLAANSEARRAVIGQVLSYAAALRRLPYEEFDRRFQQRADRALQDAVESIANEDPLEWSSEEFRAAVSNNLASGSFRLVIAVDAITEELKASSNISTPTPHLTWRCWPSSLATWLMGMWRSCCHGRTGKKAHA